MAEKLAALKQKGGGAEPTLLWTNLNTSAAFAAQSVSVDYSKYDYLIIKTKWAASVSDTLENTVIQLIKVNATEPFIVGGSYLPSAGYRNAGIRTFTWGTNALNFDQAFLPSNGGYNNSYMVPIAIWGL